MSFNEICCSQSMKRGFLVPFVNYQAYHSFCLCNYTTWLWDVLHHWLWMTSWWRICQNLPNARKMSKKALFSELKCQVWCHIIRDDVTMWPYNFFSMLKILFRLTLSNLMLICLKLTILFACLILSRVIWWHTGITWFYRASYCHYTVSDDVEHVSHDMLYYQMTSQAIKWCHTFIIWHHRSFKNDVIEWYSTR